MNQGGLSSISVRALRILANGDVFRGLRAVAVSATFVWSVLAVGIGLRVARYVADRSLWGDEGALALNLVNKSARDLLEPLEYLQGAPTGFLLVEKGMVELLGDDEFALRLFPLVCGILSLFLFAAVARRVLEPVGAALALLLFATAEPLVYYSTEVKQYSTDVAAALVLLLGVLIIDWRAARAWQFVLAGIAAGSVVWFSHSALIVLPALALALLVAFTWTGEGRALRAVASASAIAGTAAVAAFWVNHDNARRVASAAVSSETGSGGGFDRLVEPLRDVWGAFPDPIGLARTTTGLGVIACLVGLSALARVSPKRCLVIATPIVAALAASTLHLYPFSNRFILFLVPFFALLLAAGLDALLRAPWRAAPIGALAIALIFAYPVARAAGNLVSPPGHEELKNVLDDVQARWQPGDALYVWYQTQYPFRYYAECSDCGVLDGRGPAEVVWPPNPVGLEGYSALASNPPRLFVGRRDHSLTDYAGDLARLRDRDRVWLLFSSTWNDEFVRYSLDCLGTKLEEFRAERAVAYLYDLDPARRTAAGCTAGLPPIAAAPTRSDD